MSPLRNVKTLDAVAIEVEKMNVPSVSVVGLGRNARTLRWMRVQ
jgi:hypothetical protein